mmetsp:Transcript_10803/g.26850  ORF Transcript_10803/g.26850 Transcript_10803/m.26850 type:complete len:216 (-) Transcript_10803:387-1034(-)
MHMAYAASSTAGGFFLSLKRGATRQRDHLDFLSHTRLPCAISQRGPCRAQQRALAPRRGVAPSTSSLPRQHVSEIDASGEDVERTGRQEHGSCERSRASWSRATLIHHQTHTACRRGCAGGSAGSRWLGTAGLARERARHRKVAAAREGGWLGGESAKKARGYRRWRRALGWVHVCLCGWGKCGGSGEGARVSARGRGREGAGMEESQGVGAESM